VTLIVTKNQKLDADLGLLKNDVVGESFQLGAPVAFSDKMKTSRVRDNGLDDSLDLTEERITQYLAALIVVMPDTRIDVTLE
jgi:hypothetical protein